MAIENDFVLHGSGLSLDRRRLYSTAKTGDERWAVGVHPGLLLREPGTIKSSSHWPVGAGIVIMILRRHIANLVLVFLGVMLNGGCKVRNTKMTAWRGSIRDVGHWTRY